MILAALLTACTRLPDAGADKTNPLASADLRILVDSIHAHNAINEGIEAEPFSYHSIYGFKRAFAYLRSRGVRIDEISTGRLNLELLSRYRMLFINLVSGDRPPFLISEIAAIKSFVKNGGGLFVITDHTNCYYHAHILTPLMDELGIRLYRETACDRSPDTLGNGSGWIAIARFKPHPVTAGLRTIAFQTGGTVDDRWAVALTSQNGWGDLWQVRPYGKGDDGGYYGNWTQDPEERRGPLGVVLAREHGKGRIVIVGDQNIFGDPFINYLDNWRLWLNSVGWLLNDWKALDVDAYPTWRKPRVLCFEQPTAAAFGDSFENGMFNVYCAIGQRFAAFAGDDTSGDWPLIVLAHDDYRLSQESRAGLAAHLKAGRNIVMLGGETEKFPRVGGVISQLGRELGPPTVQKGDERWLASWSGTGRIIILQDKEGYANSVVPLCTAAPTPQQMLHTSALMRTLSAAMR